MNVAKHLWNVAERLRTIAVHCGALCKRCKGFRTVAVRCSALQCISGNVAEGLQTIVELYGACSASSTSPAVECITYSAPIIVVHYRNVTESLWTTGTLADNCGALRCTTVHYGALRKPCEPLKRFQTIVVQYDALRCK